MLILWRVKAGGPTEQPTGPRRLRLAAAAGPTAAGLDDLLRPAAVWLVSQQSNGTAAITASKQMLLS